MKKHTSETRETQAGELQGYERYEYQILATVWVALDLILKRKVCSFITVEPASKEDVATTIETKTNSQCTNTPLEIQIKTRQTGPWSGTAFVGVLNGKSSPAKKKGPPRRQRPLAALQRDPSQKYLFITDAGVQSELRPYIVKQIGDDSAATHIPGDDVFRDNLVRRIGIMDLRVQGIFDLEVADMLRRWGQVPSGKHESCLRELKEAVRARLLGKKSSNWNREEIEAIVRRHEGMPSQEREIVLPSNFSNIHTQLTLNHCLVLLGPPGTGKTFVAEHLVSYYRIGDEPFEIVRREQGIGQVREQLQGPNAVLCFFEDPWGEYDPKGAVQWAPEIPKLLRLLGPRKKILIVSRSGVFKKAVGEEGKVFSSAEIDLSEENYTEEMRWQILRLHLRSATVVHQEVAEREKEQIIKKLRAPYSLEVFASAFGRVPDPNSADIERLIQDSEIAAIGSHVKKTFDAAGRHIAGGAIVLWAMFMAHGAVSRAMAIEARRFLTNLEGGLGSDPELALQHLCNGGWAHKEHGSESFRVHPTVLEGLQLLFEGNQGLGEYALNAELNGLIDNGKIDEAFSLLKRLPVTKFPITQSAQGRIDEYLSQRVGAAKGTAFREAFYDLLKFGRGTDAVTIVARALYDDRKRNTIVYWKVPTMESGQVEKIRISREAKHCACNWIELILPTSFPLSFKAGQLPQFFKRFAWDLSDHFLCASEEVLESGAYSAPIDVVVEGALATDRPDFERLFEAILKSHDRLRGDDSSLQAANRAELNTAHAEHVWELANEEAHAVETALQTAVQGRRVKQGYQWILDHPSREILLRSWANSMNESTTEEEVSAMTKVAAFNARPNAWLAIKKSRRPEYLEWVLGDVGNSQIENAGAALAAAASIACSRKEGFSLATFLKSLPQSLLASRFHDWKVDWPEEPIERKAELLKATLDEHVRSALDICEGAYPKGQETAIILADKVISALRTFVADASEGLATKAVQILRKRGIPLDISINRLLASQDPYARETALEAGNDPTADVKRESLLAGLEDIHYRCRCAAMRSLAPKASPLERDRIISLGQNGSAPCRKICAELIGQHGWIEGVPVLLNLMRDTHDDSMNYTGTREYDVGYAAAISLRKFECLGRDVCEKIAHFLREPESCEDLNLARCLVFVLGQQPLEDCDLPLLQNLLQDPNYLGWDFRGYPLRYAAARCLLNQLCKYPVARALVSTEKIFTAANYPDLQLAGPALLCLGMMGARSNEKFAMLLPSQEHINDRVMLILCGRHMAGLKDIPKSLQQVIEKEHPLLKILGVLPSEAELDKEYWQVFRKLHPDVESWLSGLSEQSEIDFWFRFALKVLFGEAIVAAAQ